MDINLTGQFGGLPINLIIHTTTQWFDNPDWWQVIVTFIVGILAVAVAWMQLKKLDKSVSDVKDSVDELEGTIRGKLSVSYSATSIRSRYKDEDFTVKDVLDVIHDCLTEREKKIEKDKLEHLVEAAANLADEIDKG